MEETNEMSLLVETCSVQPTTSLNSLLCPSGDCYSLLTRLLSFCSRIFRKKKRVRHPFSSLFSLSASESWLHGSIFQNVGSPPSEDIWLEGVRRLDTSLGNESGESESLFLWWKIISKGPAATMWFWTNPGTRVVLIQRASRILNIHLKSSPHYFYDPDTYVSQPCKID